MQWFSFMIALAAQDDIRVIVRADDMGAAHSINEACIEACRNGVARSVEVIVPGPWFLEAAKLLRENPTIDPGIHLCLTSEWENVKWRPVTGPSSVADANGYFFPMTRQRKDFPPATGLIDAKPKIEDVERELRAQFELGKKHIPNLSHVSVHMGTATAIPEWRDLTQRLAAEYKLPLQVAGMKSVRGFKGEAALAEALDKLQPGLWLIVEHPGFDTPEMRALSHIGYTNVAEDRAAVTKAFTSDRVKETIKRKGIKLTSYAEALKGS